MKETFDRIRDRHDRVRAVVDSVRTDMRGEPRAEIAAELARRLATAGLPDLPENVDQKAALIVDLPDALISLGAALVRVVAGRPGPAGLRRESRYLDGATWTPVGVTDDPLAQRTLRVFDTMRPSDACEMYIGRLVAVPSDEVAVFLGSTFIGMLPPDAARAVRPIAEQTDAADQKLLVKGKITSTDAVRTLAVALPQASVAVEVESKSAPSLLHKRRPHRPMPAPSTAVVSESACLSRRPEAWF
jgi:hypothetical protein